ncbi:LemA family protein [uncultured Aquitalea sp.]|uniref:LemA family protein n=1 Tax=uncultured Aquitalea sp. TaxID=540272 RepID=UPI0025D1EF3A|nr:LemA family protein [uncultured Aquitalea sp.]
MKLAIFFGVIAVIGLYFVTLYNALVSLKHEVSKSWSNIDVVLKQRHDELPKLVEVCKQYAQFEQATLARVMEARSAVAQHAQNRNMEGLGREESKLRGLLGQVFAVAEAYPELKADEQFSHLSSRISQLEETIADRRELYNEAVNNNNVRIEQFPDVLIARMFGFPTARALQFSTEEKRDVDMQALFRQS